MLPFLLKQFLAQGSRCSRAVCRLVFVFPLSLTVPKGWTKAPVLDGWVQIVRGPRPKSEQWPSSKSGKKSPQSRDTKVVHPYFPPRQPSRPPEQVVAEANEEVLKLEAAVRALGESSVHAKPLVEALKAARAKSRVQPVTERLVACRNSLEPRKRVPRAEELIAKATEQKSDFVLEVQEAEERLQHLEAEAAKPAPPSVPTVTGESRSWCENCELRNALEFGDNTTIAKVGALSGHGCHEFSGRRRDTHTTLLARVVSVSVPSSGFLISFCISTSRAMVRKGWSTLEGA